MPKLTPLQRKLLPRRRRKHSRAAKPKSAGPAGALKVSIRKDIMMAGARFYIDDSQGNQIMRSRVYKNGAEARMVAGWMIGQLAADNFESFDYTS